VTKGKYRRSRRAEEESRFLWFGVGLFIGLLAGMVLSAVITIWTTTFTSMTAQAVAAVVFGGAVSIIAIIWLGRR